MAETILWGSKQTATGANARRYLGHGFHAGRSATTSRYSAEWVAHQPEQRLCSVVHSWQPRSGFVGSLSFGVERERDGITEEVHVREIDCSPGQPSRLIVDGLNVTIQRGDVLRAFVQASDPGIMVTPYQLSTRVVLR